MVFQVKKTRGIQGESLIYFINVPSYGIFAYFAPNVLISFFLLKEISSRSCSNEVCIFKYCLYLTQTLSSLSDYLSECTNIFNFLASLSGTLQKKHDLVTSWV